jgi:hypothetical protein
MLQLNNEAQARASAVDFSNQAAQAWESFREKQGADAGPEAYKNYQDSLGKLRDQFRQSLSPVAGGLYDQQSFSVLERLNLYGATHSGEQLDAYQKTTAKATAESAADLATKNPADVDAYHKALAQSDSAVENNFRGQSGVDIDQQKAIARSRITYDRVAGMADRDPISADKLLSDPETIKNLRGEDMGKLTKYVRGELNRNSGHTITQGLFDGSSMQLGSSPVDINKAQDAIGQIESSGDYSITNSRSGALGKYQVMPYNLQPWLKEAGLPSMTPQEFLENHDAQDQVFNKIYGDFMKQYGNANDATSVWFTGKPMKEAGPNVSDGGNTNASYIAKFNAALAKTASSGDLTTAARAHAQKLAPDDPDLPDIAASETETRYNQIQKDTRTQSLQVQNNIDQTLINQVGTGPMSLNALMQNDAFADAYRQLQPKDQLKVQGKILSMSKQDNVETQQRTDNFQKLQGLAYVDQDAFKGQDIVGTDLTANQRTQLQKMRNDAVNGKLDTDPVLTTALRDGDIQSMLQDAGITRKDSLEEYQKFVGAMKEEVLFARAKGKELSPEEMQDKAAGLLRQQSTGGWFGSSVGAPLEYEQPLHAIPKDQIDKIRNAFSDAKRPEPSDIEIEHVWAKHLYNEVQGVKTGGR